MVERSDDSEIRANLDDLTGSPHAVVVFESEGSETIIACGEIGGFLFAGDDDDDDLAIGLREQGGSGFAGVALFDDEDDDNEVDVDVFLAHEVVGSAATPGVNA